MIDIQAALNFLNTKLWNDEKKAYKEALTIEVYHHNDNFLAWITMQRFDPERAKEIKDVFLKDYWDTRWCIVMGDTENFRQSPNYLPDWYGYADLVALQHLYNVYAGSPDMSTTYGILRVMYDGEYLLDRATFKEGCTTYKLSLFALGAVMVGDLAMAEKLLETVSEWQVKEGDETGGVKTEKVECADPEWRGFMRWLANTETTCLAMLAQQALDDAKIASMLKYGVGIGGTVIGIPLILRVI